MKYNLTIGENRFKVEIERIENEIAKVNVNGRPFEVKIENYLQSAAGSDVLSSIPDSPPSPVPAAPVKQPEFVPAPSDISPSKQVDTPQVVPAPDLSSRSATAPAVSESPVTGSPVSAGGSTVTAPIPGLILDIKVNKGDSVSAGQTVAVMEAMKMENNIVTSTAGSVKEIRTSKGAEVASGDVIMVIG